MKKQSKKYKREPRKKAGRTRTKKKIGGMKKTPNLMLSRLTDKSFAQGIAGTMQFRDMEHYSAVQQEMAEQESKWQKHQTKYGRIIL